MQTGYQEIFHFSITIWEVLGNVLVATICGSFISLFYTLTHRQISYSVNFAKSMVMLAMLTSFVMMVIGDNLARAFGMVGLISLIQFRTTMKGARDFMFLYFALAIGLAAGVGLYAVALVGTFSIGGIIWLVTGFKPATNQQQVFILQYTSGEDKSQEQQAPDAVLQQLCPRYKLLSSKSGVNGEGVFTKLSYHIILKPGDRGHDLINELHRKGMKDISIQLQKN